MTDPIKELLDQHPVIASVKSEEDSAAVLDSDCTIVFVLFGSILNIESIVNNLVEGGKIVFVNVDLLDGFSARDVVIEYLKNRTKVTGILSNKAAIVKAARRQGLIAVHRLFLVDSMSFDSVPKQIQASGADCVEILPGCIPTVIGWLVEEISVPIIAGGLVCEKADVVASIGAGASAVASSNREVWAM